MNKLQVITECNLHVPYVKHGTNQSKTPDSCLKSKIELLNKFENKHTLDTEMSSENSISKSGIFTFKKNTIVGTRTSGNFSAIQS